MGIFGGSIRLRDVIAGAAKSIDDELKDDIKRTKTLADDIQLYHMKKRQEDEATYTENKEEVENILEQIAGYVDMEAYKGNPNINRYDVAASIYAGEGGTIEANQTMLDTVRDSQIKGVFDAKTMFNYANLETGGRNINDYVNQFTKMPSSLQTGYLSNAMPLQRSGLYGAIAGKTVDISQQTKSALEAFSPSLDKPEPYTGPLSGVKYDKLATAEEYERQKELAETNIKIRAEELALKIIQKEQFGTIDAGQINKDYNTLIKQGAKALNLPVNLDDNGNVIGFKLKTTDAKYVDAQNLYVNSIKSLTEEVARTNSFGIPGVEGTLKTLATTGLNYNIQKWSKVDDMKVGELYNIGADIKNPTGVILFTGNLEDSIVLRTY